MTGEKRAGRDKILNGLSEWGNLTEHEYIRLRESGVEFTIDGFKHFFKIGTGTLYHTNIDLKEKVQSTCRLLKRKYKSNKISSETIRKTTSRDLDEFCQHLIEKVKIIKSENTILKSEIRENKILIENLAQQNILLVSENSKLKSALNLMK